jgi:hypothetical protein
MLLHSLLVGLRSQAEMQAEIVALRHQLTVLQRTQKPRRLALKPSDRCLWVWLSRLWLGWRSALVIVRPETVWVANSKLGQNPSFSSVLRSVVKRAFVVFGNSTISLHILRGVLAAAAIYGSLATMSRTIWPSIILLPTAVYLMKG